jgi:hypothetical protein
MPSWFLLKCFPFIYVCLFQMVCSIQVCPIYSYVSQMIHIVPIPSSSISTPLQHLLNSKNREAHPPYDHVSQIIALHPLSLIRYYLQSHCSRATSVYFTETKFRAQMQPASSYEPTVGIKHQAFMELICSDLWTNVPVKQLLALTSTPLIAFEFMPFQPTFLAYG